MTNIKTRIPFSETYINLLGIIVYAFAYYEWTLINIIEKLDEGFLVKYCRGNPKPSGRVLKDFQKIIELYTISDSMLSKSELETCSKQFSSLVKKRNALIHAHPITYKNGDQILAYQSKPVNDFSDKIWRIKDLETLIQEIDNAAIYASAILTKLRSVDTNS